MGRRNDHPTRDGTTRTTGTFSRRRILQLAGAGIVGSAMTAGTAVAETGSYSNDLEIVAEESVSYTFTTTGPLERLFAIGVNSAERGNDSVTENDDGTWTASGFTGNGYGDGYSFEGSVSEFEVEEGSCTVYLNGEEVSIDDLVGDANADSGSDVVDDGPVGGGEGYDDVVSPDQADVVASTRSDLEAALSNAGSGDVVYLAGDASIDMGSTTFEVPAGVTLASNRGIDDAPGAHLYTDEETKSIRLEEGARLTGVRVQGPFEEYFDPDYYARGSGVRVNGGDVEVDNNEIWGFAYASVATNSYSPHVHHNNIHHNPRDGLGYGVVAGSGRPLIEWNYFNYNRHSIASSGSGGYVVRYNRFGSDTIGHVIDMHRPGGSKIEIYNNTVEAVTSVADGERKSAVAIRGVPDDQANIRDNWFYNDLEPLSTPSGWTDEAIIQVHVGSWTNVRWSNNHLGSTEPAASIGCPR